MWTLTNLVVQIVAGILGGHAAATAAKDHSFGVLGHTLAGAVGGGLSGLLLQTLPDMVVSDASGTVNGPTAVDHYVLQGLTGAVAGAILMVVVGFLKHSIEAHKSKKD
jgi:hypothetical protein